MLVRCPNPGCPRKGIPFSVKPITLEDDNKIKKAYKGLLEDKCPYCKGKGLRPLSLVTGVSRGAAGTEEKKLCLTCNEVLPMCVVRCPNCDIGQLQVIRVRKEAML